MNSAYATAPTASSTPQTTVDIVKIEQLQFSETSPCSLVSSTIVFLSKFISAFIFFSCLSINYGTPSGAFLLPLCTFIISHQVSKKQYNVKIFSKFSFSFWIYIIDKFFYRLDFNSISRIQLIFSLIFSRADVDVVSHKIVTVYLCIKLFISKNSFSS